MSGQHNSGAALPQKPFAAQDGIEALCVCVRIQALEDVIQDNNGPGVIDSSRQCLNGMSVIHCSWPSWVLDATHNSLFLPTTERNPLTSDLGIMLLR